MANDNYPGPRVKPTSTRKPRWGTSDFTNPKAGYKELTVKQTQFVEEYLGTLGNLKEAVSRTYDAKNPLGHGYKLMNNPKIKDAIDKRIQDEFPDGILAERHKALLYKNDLDRDGNDTGQPDTQAVAKALDMAYKLKGSYAAEKSTVMNVNVDMKPTDENMEAIRLEFENRIKEQLAQPTSDILE